MPPFPGAALRPSLACGSLLTRLPPAIVLVPSGDFGAFLIATPPATRRRSAPGAGRRAWAASAWRACAGASCRRASFRASLDGRLVTGGVAPGYFIPPLRGRYGILSVGTNFGRVCFTRFEKGADGVVDDLADGLRREVSAGVRPPVVGESAPESLVAVGAQDGGGEVGGRVGDQRLLAVAQAHALRADRGRHDGQGVCERLADLALDARAEAYGRDEDARARKQGLDLRHVAEQPHATGRVGGELRRRVVADDQQLRPRQLPPDERQDFADEEVDGVRVGPVEEVADEEEVLARAEGEAWPARLVNRRDDDRGHAGRFALHHFLV